MYILSQALNVECCVISESSVCGPGQYRCTNTHCIGMSKVCNGHDECGDNSDEHNCSE